MAESSADFCTVFGMDIRNSQWMYRGEGNGSIVISIGNTGRVLRIVKIPAAKNDNGPEAAALLHEDTKYLGRLVAFVRETLAPLLGRKFIHPGEIVSISGDDLKYLNGQLETLRPDFRKHRILPEVDSLALCLPDLCSAQCLLGRLPEARLVGPVLSVEIKPKMGFLRGERLSTFAKDGGRFGQWTGPLDICKYHMMQHWKLKMGSISEISRYCPLDLFSGCRCRTRKALEGLLRNPQNNLRLFENGKLIYGSEKSSVFVDSILQEVFPDIPREKVTDHLMHLLSDALLKDHQLDEVDIVESLRIPWTGQHCCHEEIFSTYGHTVGHGSFHSCERCHLPSGSVLNRVLNVQRRSAMSAGQLLADHQTFTRELLELPEDKVQELLYGPCLHSEQPTTKTPFEAALNRIKNYLLSCTACDCSLMITLGQIQNASNPQSPWMLQDPQYPGVTYLHSVAVLDTDWKSHDRISRHATEEQLIVEHVLDQISGTSPLM